MFYILCYAMLCAVAVTVTLTVTVTVTVIVTVTVAVAVTVTVTVTVTVAITGMELIPRGKGAGGPGGSLHQTTYTNRRRSPLVFERRIRFQNRKAR